MYKHCTDIEANSEAVRRDLEWVAPQHGLSLCGWTPSVWSSVGKLIKIWWTLSSAGETVNACFYTVANTLHSDLYVYIKTQNTTRHISALIIMCIVLKSSRQISVTYHVPFANMMSFRTDYKLQPSDTRSSEANFTVVKFWVCNWRLKS